MAKTSVILPKGRPDFRRTMRDADGKVIKDKDGNDRVLMFPAGSPVELDADELEAVRDDIGPALQIAKVDEKQKPAHKADGEATRKFVEETKKLRAKQQEERNAAKADDAPARAVARPAMAPAPVKAAEAKK